MRVAALDAAVSARSDGPSYSRSSKGGWMDGMRDGGKTLGRVDGHAGISLCAKLSQMAGNGRWKIKFPGPILIQNSLG